MPEIQYKLEYDENGARQVGDEIAPTATSRGQVDKAKRRRRRIPSSVQTAITVIVCGGLFFSAVAFAPKGLRPQDFTGEYVSDVAAEVKARESEIQAELDAYTNGVRGVIEQQNMRYNRVSEGVLQAYKASNDLNQMQVENANRLRGSLVDRQLGQTAQANGANLGFASIAEMLGQAQNIFEPGSGDAALAEAKHQRGIATSRMTDTAIQSAAVDVTPYVNRLVTVEQVRRELESIPQIDLPPPPRFDRRAN